MWVRVDQRGSTSTGAAWICSGSGGCVAASKSTGCVTDSADGGSGCQNSFNMGKSNDGGSSRCVASFDWAMVGSENPDMSNRESGKA